MEAQSGSTAVSGGRIRASSAPSKRSSRKNTREIDEKVAENGAFFECRTRQFALFRADCTQLQHASLPALTFAECACLGRSLDRQICTGAPFFAGRGTKQHMYDLIDLPIAPILSRDWSVPRVLNHCDRSLVRQAHRSRVRLGWKRGPRTVRSSPGSVQLAGSGQPNATDAGARRPVGRACAPREELPHKQRPSRPTRWRLIQCLRQVRPSACDTCDTCDAERCNRLPGKRLRSRRRCRRCDTDRPRSVVSATRGDGDPVFKSVTT
jgi:hypothetical protein